MTIGDPNTGKTCLIKRFCKEKFDKKYITTIGLDYGVNKFDMQGRRVAVKMDLIFKMSIFDISGDESYEEVRNEFYEVPNVKLPGFMLVDSYDLFCDG